MLSIKRKQRIIRKFATHANAPPWLSKIWSISHHPRQHFPFHHPTLHTLPQLAFNLAEPFTVMLLPEVCNLVISQIQGVSNPETCFGGQQQRANQDAVRFAVRIQLPLMAENVPNDEKRLHSKKLNRNRSIARCFSLTTQKNHQRWSGSSRTRVNSAKTS